MAMSERNVLGLYLRHRYEFTYIFIANAFSVYYNANFLYLFVHWIKLYTDVFMNKYVSQMIP